MDKEAIISNCKKLLYAYKHWLLGIQTMPEDTSPVFKETETELRIAYFTLPMSLNYQRNSYKLWEAALKTYNNQETKKVFDIKLCATMPEELLRNYLIQYKIALQPNKHIKTWQTIAQTIFTKRGSFKKLFETADYDFLELKNMIQTDFKKDLPYISWPKIFNYRSFIIQKYGKIKLKNSEFISIAPDTHITKCSIILWVITETEANTLTKDSIAQKWLDILKWSWINPIDMHPPLWFWSRNNFQYTL